VTDRGDLHGRPTAKELLDAVIAFLREQLPGHVDDSMKHQVRIASHALEIVNRELQLGREQDAAHRARLDELGMPDDRALADAIKSGEVGDSDRLRRALTEDTRDRVRVANPKWLPPDP
jgi:hypothetical protein